MKTTLKMLSLILALIMCVCTFAGCKDKKEEEQTTQTTDSVSTGPVSNDLEARNLAGKEFVILDANDHPTVHINYAEDMEGSAVEQALYKRDKHVEERSNFEIKYEPFDNLGLPGISVVTTAMSSGDRPYDLVVSTASGGRLTTLACEGILANLKSMPNLDFSQKWWMSESNDALTLGGKMYFTTGDIMASVYGAPMAVFGNKTLLEQYQIDDNLYNKVRYGEWTMEYLAMITTNITTDVNHDGVLSTDMDFFGVIAQPIKMSAVGMLVGMGFENSYVQDDSLIVVNDNEEVIEKLCDTIKKAVSEVKCENNDNGNVVYDTFENDRAVFLVHLIESANSGLRDMESDFAILPMPKADEAQENYRTYINGWVDCFIAVPSYDTSDTDYADYAGYVIESMARASYDIVRPIAYEQVVMYQSARDADAVEMLEIIFNTLYIDFQGIFDFGGSTIGEGGVSTMIANYVFNKGNLASDFARINSKMKSAAETYSQQWINATS